MHRRNTVRLGLSLLLAAGLAVTGAAMPSAEARPAEPAAGSASTQKLVNALQRDLGLTADEARTRLRQESAAAGTEAAARRAAGQAFGGAWFDAETGRLVVGVTDDADRRRAAAVRKTGAATVTVPHSAAELGTAKDRLDARSRKRDVPAGVHGWHIDPRAGGIVVTVGEGAAGEPAVRAFLREARTAAAVPVTVDATAHGAPRTFASGVVGGDPYYINGNTRCSIGFSVHGGFVSAGHCGGAGSPVVGWDGSWMGTFEASHFPGDDMSFIRIGGGWWTVPVVLGWGTVPDRLVRGSNEAPVGASICRSGSTTHWHCGTVLGKNQTVVYGGATYVHGLTRTSVCAEPGDSGGSYISGDQAQGVTSGGWGDCRSGGETWYQPVNEILQHYGLTLHTA